MSAASGCEEGVGPHSRDMGTFMELLKIMSPIVLCVCNL